MQRHTATYPLARGQAKELKQRMLNWANQFSILLFLDSNNYADPYGRYECLLAAGLCSADVSGANHAESFSSLQQLHDIRRDWLFGHLCYDVKNILEPKLTTTHPDHTGFPLMYFFVPQTVCYIDKEQTVLTISSFDDPAEIYSSISGIYPIAAGTIPHVRFTGITDKADYLETVGKLRNHIADGDCYEINYCNAGYSSNAEVQPLVVFGALNELSPAPQAAYYRLEDKYMMCASPERYLLKHGKTILSQPIKGTAKRGTDAATDEDAKISLRNSIKEQAENVMITDLVRNDLARSCEAGSITVNELFGIYTFPQVHQMISTVSGTLRDDVPFTDAVKHSFPMGSMTGAPKFKVMQLIDHYERSARGLFSGTVGYISPDGDFDLNVIIRSLFYNASTRYLSYQTGGAITYDSDAEQEWEEMRLKAWALERIFS